jgi:hypothetical protein
MGFNTEVSRIRSGLKSGKYRNKPNRAKAFMDPFIKGIERQELERIQKDKEDRARAAAAAKAAAAEQKAKEKADAKVQDMVNFILMTNPEIQATEAINKQLFGLAKAGDFKDAGAFQTFIDNNVKYEAERTDYVPLNKVEGSLPPEMQLRQDQVAAEKSAVASGIKNKDMFKQAVQRGVLSQEELNQAAQDAGDYESTKIPQPDPAAVQTNAMLGMDPVNEKIIEPSLTFGKKPPKVSEMEERAIVAELNDPNLAPERKAALENELAAINFQTNDEIFDKIPAVTDMKSFRNAVAAANALPESAGKQAAIDRVNQIGGQLIAAFDQDFLQDLTSVDKITAAEGELEAMPEIYEGQKARLEKLLEAQKSKFATIAAEESAAKLAQATGSELQLKRYALDPETGLMNFKVTGGTVTRKPDGKGGYLFTTTSGKPLSEEEVENSVFYTTDEADLIVKIYNDEVSKANNTITESTVAVATIIDLQKYVETEGKEALNPFTNAMGDLADKLTAAGDAAVTIFSVNNEGKVGDYQQVESEFLEALGNLSGKDRIVAQKTLATAYAIAKMRGSVGQALSDRELKSILATLGQGVTDPAKLVSILDELLKSEVNNAEVRRKGFANSILAVGGEVEIINSTGVGKPIYETILNSLEEGKAKFQSVFEQQLEGQSPSRRPDAASERYHPSVYVDAFGLRLKSTLPNIAEGATQYSNDDKKTFYEILEQMEQELQNAGFTPNEIENLVKQMDALLPTRDDVIRFP